MRVVALPNRSVDSVSCAFHELCRAMGVTRTTQAQQASDPDLGETLIVSTVLALPPKEF